MTSITLIRRLLAAAVVCLGMGQAQATEFNLNLTGMLSDGSFGSYDWLNTVD